MFETRTEFLDSLFYDVSSWTLPLAFNLDYDLNYNGNYSKKVNQLKFTVDSDTTGKSIYTRKLFDKYIRVA